MSRFGEFPYEHPWSRCFCHDLPFDECQTCTEETDAADREADWHERFSEDEDR